MDYVSIGLDAYLKKNNINEEEKMMRYFKKINQQLISIDYSKVHLFEGLIANECWLELRLKTLQFFQVYQIHLIFIIFGNIFEKCCKKINDSS